MNADFKRIYFIRFASNFCQASFFPFFAVWLMKEKLFLATGSAVIVSIGIFSTRLCAPFLSSHVKKYDKKYSIFFALCLLLGLYSALFFLATYKIHDMALWVTVSFLIGGALSMNSLSLLSYLAIHQDEHNHHRGFSFINMALNLSSGLGPFLGAITLAFDKTIFPLIPILFAMLSMGVVFFLNHDRVFSRTVTKINEKTFSAGGPQFLFFICINMMTFVAYAQFYDVFPLYAFHYLNEKTIGLLFIISSVVIVIVQFPMNRLLLNFSNQFSMLLSNAILAIGTLLFIAASEKWLMVCILGVVLISMAEVMYAPMYQTLAVQLYQPNNPVRALAIQSFSWGVAEAVATFLGIVVVGAGYGYVSFILGGIAAVMVGVFVFGKRACSVSITSY
ncbi:MAG: hypothetical protein A3F13_05750 [Gammaproteobacteria bacterium RIFCSPHIGHO2_12_FULL_40_19]|nr:MAG: hypothetical protein A3F13_05750 [Gammaproteobacteria bacterium RIFCSPHIGHO2_12_FULL_40_19]